MKIYSEIVIDIASGEVIDRVGQDWRGCVAVCKGSSTTTTQVNIPPPTPAETYSQNLATAVNEQALYAQGYNVIKQEDGNVILEPRELTAEELAQQDLNTKINEYISTNLLGGEVSEETKALVDETYAPIEEQGNQDLEDYVRQIAGMRGLDITTDSPLFRELALGKAKLESNLGGARAAAYLDVGRNKQILSAGLFDTQNMLNQQAFQNKLAISGSFQNTASGLAGLRGMQPTTTVIGPAGSSMGGLGSMLGGGGQMLQGLGSVWGAYNKS